MASPAFESRWQYATFKNLGVVGGLGAATATGTTAASTALAGEVAAGVTLASIPVAFKATSATGSTAATASTKATSIVMSSSLGAAGLDDNVLAVHGVGVARNSSLVALERLILNKGAVLIQLARLIEQILLLGRTFWRLMSK